MLLRAALPVLSNPVYERADVKHAGHACTKHTLSLEVDSAPWNVTLEQMTIRLCPERGAAGDRRPR